MQLIKGDGVYFETDTGKRMLDFTSQIFTTILGQERGLLLRAVGSTPMISCYGHHYKNPTTERYRDTLKEWTGYESVALFTTGAEATEAFWRACIVHTGKRGIWGGLIDPDLVGTNDPKCDAMHGVTLGARIMAGSTTAPELGIGPDMGAARFGLAPESTGCMIMEPYHSPSAQFHRLQPTIDRIVAHQKEFPDIPLCVDEIQGGFGRTGKKWAHQWYDGLKPDFITIAKGQGAGMPISALLGPAEIMESQAVLEHGHLHSTHSGHPVMCAVGCAVIDEIEKHGLIERSRYLGHMLDAGLRDCGVPYHAGKGLLAGLVFADKDESEAFTELCFDKGLLVCDTGREWVKVAPALIITDEELETGIALIRDAVSEVLNVRKD